MKKSLALLLAAVLALSLCACSFGTPAESTAVSPVTEAPTTTAATEPVTDPITEPVTEPVTTPVTEPVEPKKTATVSLLACGDNILYRPNNWEAMEHRAAVGASMLSYEFFYSDVKDVIAAADLAFINQETLPTGGNSGYPLFESPLEIADTLDLLGFDVVNMATNHMLDVGYHGGYSTGEGIRIARARYDTESYVTVGGYLSETDAETVRVVERNGVRFAFLAYTESTNTILLDADSAVVVPYFDEARIRADVSRAKALADVIVVSAHWGTDSSETVTDTQRYYAHFLASLGVDIILGTHSHILQSVEWIEANGHRTLCAYSLGNFMGMMERPSMMLGGFLSLSVTVTEGEEPAVEVNGFLPTVYHYNENYRASHIYWLCDYSDELAAVHGVAKKYDNPFTVAELYGMLRDTLGNLTLLSPR